MTCFIIDGFSSLLIIVFIVVLKMGRKVLLLPHFKIEVCIKTFANDKILQEKVSKHVYRMTA